MVQVVKLLHRVCMLSEEALSVQETYSFFFDSLSESRSPL